MVEGVERNRSVNEGAAWLGLLLGRERRLGEEES